MGSADSNPQTHTPLERPRRRRRMWFRCLALTFALLMAVVCAELVVRVYVAARGWTSNCYVLGISMLQPDDTNGYTLARNLRFQSGVLKISTNQFGLRGPQIAPQKKDGTKRVAIIGGSSVFGYFVNDGEEAARLLQKQLGNAGHAIEVINAGVPGYNLIQSNRRFASTVVRLQPDLVILYLGWNDLVYLLQANPDPAVIGVGPCAAAWERIAAKSTLYGLVAHRLMNAPVAQFNPPPPAEGGNSVTSPAVITPSGITPNGEALFGTQLQQITAAARRLGAHVMICSQATLANPAVDKSAWGHLGGTEKSAQLTIERGQWLQTKLRKFAADEGLPFVDVYSEIPPTEAMLGDVIHLTRAGEQRLADILERSVSEHFAAPHAATP